MWLTREQNNGKKEAALMVGEPDNTTILLHPTTTSWEGGIATSHSTAPKSPGSLEGEVAPQPYDIGSGEAGTDDSKHNDMKNDDELFNNFAQKIYC